MGKVRSNSIIGYVIDLFGKSITFTVDGVGTAKLHMDKVHGANQDYAQYYGMQQRIGDKGAIPRDPITGLSATPQEKFAAIKGMVDFYELGGDAWNMVRATSTPKDTTPLVLQAIANVYKTTIEKAKAFVQARADKKGVTLEDYLKVLAKSENIGLEILAIKTAAFKPGIINADEELAGLMSGENNDENS